MEINVTQTVRPTWWLDSGPVRAKKADVQVAETEFADSKALESKLDTVSEIRPEVVERAKGLVQTPGYPPAEVINRIAVLLASELQASQEV